MAVADSPVPNSYTVGRQGNATIVVSTGLLETLDDTELDTVLAHELAHVLNHDVTVMTMAVAPFRLARLLAGTLKRLLSAAGLIIWYTLYLGVVLAAIVPILLFVLAGFIAIIDPGPTAEVEIVRGAAQWFFGTFMGYVAGFGAILLTGGLFLIPVVFLLSVYYVILGVIPRRLSIYREYAADRGAALLTGTPTTFASALESLSNATDRPTVDFRQATDVQALCLVSGGISDETEDDSTQQSSSDDSPLFEAVRQRISAGIVAHPPIEERIDRLREMSKNLEE